MSLISNFSTNLRKISPVIIQSVNAVCLVFGTLIENICANLSNLQLFSFGNASFANLIVSMNLISICLSLPS